MQDWLQARASATPHHTALIYNDQRWTWRELHLLAGRLCSRLQQMNIRPGTFIGVVMNNEPEAVVTVHALARGGYVMVPLNTRLTAAEINWQLQRAGVGLVLHTAGTAETAANLDANRHEVDLTELPATTAEAKTWNLEATQAIVFTSGTSGQPKGAEITFGNHFYSATASAFRIGHQNDDIWLSVLPLYHVGGLAVLFRCALYGITTLLHPRFDIHAIGASFRNQRVTLISLVPTMLHRMLQQDTTFPPSLRLILLGGAAATPDLLNSASTANLPVAATYGLTEASSQVATALPDATRRKPGSVGRPLMFTEVRIIDDTGAPQPSGEYGEVTVKGPTVMRGYFRDPQATNTTIRDGWLHTGDIGYMDEDGDLWLVQRRSDLIVSGGENVYPAEGEAVIREHPDVADVSVVGLDDAEWGQRVAAAVVTVSGAVIDEETIIAHCREHLAGYKTPRSIIMVDELPQTASGKVQRDGVRTLFDKG